MCDKMETILRSCYSEEFFDIIFGKCELTEIKVENKNQEILHSLGNWLKENKKETISEYTEDPFHLFYGIKEQNSEEKVTYLLTLNKKFTDKVLILLLKNTEILTGENNVKDLVEKLNRDLNFSALEEITFLNSIEDNPYNQYPANFYALAVTILLANIYCHIKRVNIGLTSYFCDFFSFKQDKNFFQTQLYCSYLILLDYVKRHHTTVALTITTFEHSGELVEAFCYNFMKFEDFLLKIKENKKEDLNIISMLSKLDLRSINFNLFSKNIITYELELVDRYLDCVVQRKKNIEYIESKTVNEMVLYNFGLYTHIGISKDFQNIIKEISSKAFSAGYTRIRIKVINNYGEDLKYQFDELFTNVKEEVKSSQNLCLEGIAIGDTEKQIPKISGLQLKSNTIITIPNIMSNLLSNLKELSLNYIDSHMLDTLIKISETSPVNKLRKIDLLIKDPDIITTKYIEELIPLFISFKSLQDIRLQFEINVTYDLDSLWYKYIIYQTKKITQCVYFNIILINITSSILSKNDGIKIPETVLDEIKKLKFIESEYKSYVIYMEYKTAHKWRNFETLLLSIKSKKNSSINLQTLNKGPIITRLFEYLTDSFNKVYSIEIRNK
jgi:hypothetical protein